MVFSDPPISVMMAEGEEEELHLVLEGSRESHSWKFSSHSPHRDMCCSALLQIVDLATCMLVFQ